MSGLVQSYPLYRQLGLASVGHEIVDEHHFSDRLVLVAVRWTFFDENEDVLTDSNPLRTFLTSCTSRNRQEKSIRSCDTSCPMREERDHVDDEIEELRAVRPHDRGCARPVISTGAGRLFRCSRSRLA